MGVPLRCCLCACFNNPKGFVWGFFRFSAESQSRLFAFHPPTNQSLVAALLRRCASLPPPMSPLCLKHGSTAQEHWWDALRRLPFVEFVDVVRGPCHPSLPAYCGARNGFLGIHAVREQQLHPMALSQVPAKRPVSSTATSVSNK